MPVPTDLSGVSLAVGFRFGSDGISERCFRFLLPSSAGELGRRIVQSDTPTTSTNSPFPHENQTILSYNQDCTDCSEGYYCETTGLVEPTGPCHSGHYCKRKVDTAAPTTGITIDSGVSVWR